MIAPSQRVAMVAAVAVALVATPVLVVAAVLLRGGAS